MKIVLWILVMMAGGYTFAQDMGDVDRDPAAIKTYAGKRTYPGGGDEEDLQVQARIPEATLKTDARSVQREVYKSLYKQEMKEERQETVEE
jgi:hypothetical protein